jgi:hypothetical protein
VQAVAKKSAELAANVGEFALKYGPLVLSAPVTCSAYPKDLPPVGIGEIVGNILFVIGFSASMEPAVHAVPAVNPAQSSTRGGRHPSRLGDVGGSVEFSALGDIVGGDKIVNHYDDDSDLG